MKRKTISVFIPELACPFRCIYCNQHLISGTLHSPLPEETIEIIEKQLSTIIRGETYIEIAFFGGNFTGLTLNEQEAYLKIANQYLVEKKIDSIRISTRPDYINNENILLLKKYGVKTIELGAQSLDDKVLKESKRGHLSDSVINASKLILKNEFNLGLQMMIGLPGATKTSEIETARKIFFLGATSTRIYPTIVIEGTELYNLYKNGSYKPLSIEEAVERTKAPYKFFEEKGLEIIRVGLHPSEFLLDSENEYVGPFHVSFRELVLTSIWLDEFKKYTFDKNLENIEIFVAEKEINYAIGYNSTNKKYLEKMFKEVHFKIDNKLKNRTFNVNYC